MSSVEPPKKVKKPPKFITQMGEYLDRAGGVLSPSDSSPLCQTKCKLYTLGCRSPFLEPVGSTDPLITFVYESVSPGEDRSAQAGVAGTAALVKRFVEALSPEVGFDPSRARYIPLVRCAPPPKLKVQTKANWCRWHTVSDLQRFPPQLVVPIGTVALGALSHKSNANDWSGKLLTWRGWPDDWLTNPNFDAGHPGLGAPPPSNLRRRLWPLASPRLVYATQNPRLIKKWRDQLRASLSISLKSDTPLTYDRPWWRLTADVDEIRTILRSIPADVSLQYDTETTGLYQFAVGASIVTHQLRWEDKDGPHALAFPWDYPESPLKPYLAEITELLLEVFYRVWIDGHNLSFDAIFAIANLPGCDIDRLCRRLSSDTLHMAYILRQVKESRGLEILTYDWAPEMAGYEEEMVLLIQRYPELLDPAANAGGHYAKCPPELWQTHLRPYILGDVETVGLGKPRLRKALSDAKTYNIPLARPDDLGRFRTFSPPGRLWTYDHVMAPAQRVLTAMMARGFQVDVDEVKSQEDLMPKAIDAARKKLRASHPKVIAWADQQEATVEDWKFDLEDKKQLKTVLFNLLDLPVKKLTKTGRLKFGMDLGKISPENQLAFASTDKFALNSLSVDHPEVRPLLEYRKLRKAYSSYVRPMRNTFNSIVDKKIKVAQPHLMADGRVHASFKLTGTGSGRLSCANPNLQQLGKDSLVKKMYTTRFGREGCIFQGDFSQIELRLIASACGDPSMVNAYRQGLDLHSLTASKVFKKPYESYLKEYMAGLQKSGYEKEAKDLDRQRSISKTTNFLTSYGGGPAGLQSSLAEESVYLSIEECEEIVESFFDGYPTLRRHMSIYKDFILKHGCAVSFFGRVRYFDEVFSDDREARAKALRSGYNHLIQSAASDLMLICLSVLDQLMIQANLESRLVSTVHDSLVIDAKRSELPKIYGLCQAVLNNVPDVLTAALGEDYDTSWMIVDIAGDFECGPNYGIQMKVTGENPDWDALLAQAGGH